MQGNRDRFSPRQARQGASATRGSARRGPTLKEKGCINYDLHDSPSLPGVFVFLENWESKADFDAHIASPRIAAFRAKAPDLLAEPADITLWRRSTGD